MKLRPSSLGVVALILLAAGGGAQEAGGLGYEPVPEPPRALMLPWGTDLAPGTQFDARTGLPLRLVSVRDGTELALIPAGPFAWVPPVQPAPPSTTAFPTYIDVYPVLNSQLAAYLTATGRTHEQVNPDPAIDGWQGQSPPPGQEGHPAAFPRWPAEGAWGYLEWCGRRPPSFMEWQKAARGPDGYLWPWGNAFDPEAANLPRRRPTTADFTRPVSDFPRDRSPYGIHDLAGNLPEVTVTARGDGSPGTWAEPDDDVGGIWEVLDPRPDEWGVGKPGYAGPGGFYSLRGCIGGPEMVAALDPAQPWGVRLEAAKAWWEAHGSLGFPMRRWSPELAELRMLDPKGTSPDEPLAPDPSALVVPLAALRSHDAPPDARERAVDLLMRGATTAFLPELEELAPTLAEEEQTRIIRLVNRLRGVPDSGYADDPTPSELRLAPQLEAEARSAELRQLEAEAQDPGLQRTQRIRRLEALAAQSPESLGKLEQWIVGPGPTDEERVRYLELLAEHFPERLQRFTPWIPSQGCAVRVRFRYLDLLAEHTPEALAQLTPWADEWGLDVRSRTHYVSLLARHAPEGLVRVLEAPTPVDAGMGHTRLVAAGLTQGLSGPVGDDARDAAHRELGSFPTDVLLEWASAAQTPEAGLGAAMLLRERPGMADQLEEELAEWFVACIGAYHKRWFYDGKIGPIQQRARILQALDATRLRELLRSNFQDPELRQGAVAAASAIRDDELVPDLRELAKEQSYRQDCPYESALYALTCMATPDAVRALKDLGLYFAAHRSADTHPRHRDLTGFIEDVLALRAGVQPCTWLQPPPWFWEWEWIPPPPEGIEHEVAAALDELAARLGNEDVPYQAARLRRAIPNVPPPE